MKKTILITGASSGIGKNTSKYFHQKGWNVIATMRNPENEKELSSQSSSTIPSSTNMSTQVSAFVHLQEIQRRQQETRVCGMQ